MSRPSREPVDELLRSVVQEEMAAVSPPPAAVWDRIERALAPRREPRAAGREVGAARSRAGWSPPC